jgi:putative FmdB family regulatory protein
MPFYEYECAKCGHMLEAMQKITDAPLKLCPECRRPALKKLMSPPVFRLKGSGWYETDFKSEKEAKRNLAERPGKEENKKEEPKPAAAEAAKPEAKTETKTEVRPAAASNPVVGASAVAKPQHAGARTRKRTARRPK